MNNSDTIVNTHEAKTQLSKLLVRVEALEPIVGRHDCSRLRAWVRGCCFGDDVTAIRAPGQEARACCGPAR